MINPIHVVGILILIAGWHLDAIDQRLIEENRANLANLNIPQPEPVIIDTDARGRLVIRKAL